MGLLIANMQLKLHYQLENINTDLGLDILPVIYHEPGSVINIILVVIAEIT